MRKAMKKALAKGMTPEDMHTEFVAKAGYPEKVLGKFLHKYGKGTGFKTFGGKKFAAEKAKKNQRNTP